jgi:hypothetical protein
MSKQRKVTSATWKRRVKKAAQEIDPTGAALVIIMLHAGFALNQLWRGKEKQAEKTLVNGLRQVRDAMRISRRMAGALRRG